MKLLQVRSILPHAYRKAGHVFGSAWQEVEADEAVEGLLRSVPIALEVQEVKRADRAIEKQAEQIVASVEVSEGENEPKRYGQKKKGR